MNMNFKRNYYYYYMNPLYIFALLCLVSTIDPPPNFATSPPLNSAPIIFPPLPKTEQLPKYLPSRITTQCQTDCKECWSLQPTMCYACKEGYYFDPQGGCSNTQSTMVPGYRRSCAICGPHNFADEKNNYRCTPCEFGCSRCNQDNSGKCNVCKPEYTLDPITGQCLCKFGAEIDGGCFCNQDLFYIAIDPSLGKECLQCDQCHRNEKNCETIKCPPHFFDLDNLDCCEKCNESCDECIGNTRKDCLVKNNVRMCRNADLWEEVPGMDECYCVCYSDEVYNADTDTTSCRCHDGRIKAVSYTHLTLPTKRIV